MTNLLNDTSETNQAVPLRFTRLYVSLLIILSVLLTIGQVLTQWRLSAVQDELWIIRYAALQRHQSQMIVKQALQIADINEQDLFRQNVAELRKVFDQFERYQNQVKEGRVIDHNVYIPNAPKVQQLYRDIQPEFDAFRVSVSQLITLEQPSEVLMPTTQASLKLLLANEKPFLQEIDAIVREYTGELRMKLGRLQQIEFYLYLFTIATLLAISFLIIRPAADRLREAIGELIAAKNRTRAANTELMNANLSLQETRQQLFAATRQQYQREIDEQRMRKSYLITGQEEERKRLSRELHDGLGQMLTAIKLQLEGLEGVLRRQAATAVPAGGEEKTTPGPVATPYDRNIRNLKGLVMQTIQEIRNISNDLMPTVLSDFGVLPALKMLTESNRSTGVDVTFESSLIHNSDEPLRFDKDVEIMLYRVTQEAISNAMRHGHATHIGVELVERDAYIHLIVTDNGRGFVRKQPAMDELTPRNGRAPSQGLHNMQERTELLNGKLSIKSTPGKGTRLLVSIPYKMQLAPYDIH
ncbi:hypothetical protein GCM10027578_18880 [Spirosoma luteolum]